MIVTMRVFAEEITLKCSFTFCINKRKRKRKREQEKKKKDKEKERMNLEYLTTTTQVAINKTQNTKHVSSFAIEL